MATACAPATCAAGQVGVLTWSAAPDSAGPAPGPSADAGSGIADAADASKLDDGGATTADGGAAATDGGALPGDGGGSLAADATASANDAATSATPLPRCPGFEIKCIDPPPSCAGGQSPSYAPAGKWHCVASCDPNDPNMVIISYGGQYGAEQVCTSGPPKTPCADPAQVWTWDYQDESWVCRNKCDNGQYDRHDWNGQTVCVPC
jgi:hypothetical protein